MKQRRSWFWTWVQLFFRFKLTPLGWMAVFVLFFSAIGIFTVEVPIYQVFCSMVALWGLVEVTGMLLRPRLRVGGVFPEKVVAGETALGQVSIENAGFLPACDLMCGFFPVPAGIRHMNADLMIRSLPRGAHETLPVSLLAERRGEYLLPDLYVHSTFPLNLMRFGRAAVSARKLTVVPAFHRLEHLEIPISYRYQQGGILLDSRSGNASEYVGNREYVAGEPTRRLDFRAWARVGKPVVREYQDEICSRVALVLDTHLPWRFPAPRPESISSIEAAISLTAAVADALDQLGTTVELFAAGPELFFFHASTGDATHFDSILDILAAVEPTRHNPFENLAPAIAESLESTSVAVCMFVDWDSARDELTQLIQQSGCGLKVFLVRDLPPSQPFPHEEYYTQISPAEILAGRVRNL